MNEPELLPKRTPLSIGLLGISGEAITKGKKGWCYFPLGEYDPDLSGPKWVRRKVLAIEDIREKRDIIVADEQGGCKEHTPVELSYQSVAGPYQRVTEDFPLPITGGSKSIIWTDSQLIVAADNTVLIAPVADKKIRVHGICFSNKHGASADVAIRSGLAGGLKFRHVIAASGGNVDLNLIDMTFECEKGDGLYYFAQAAYANGVLVSVGYTLEE